MGASDRWGDYKTPCPNCGGTVQYWHFESDCGYNPGSSGIQCEECKRNFTYEEWCKIASEEMKPEVDEMRRRERDYQRKKEREKEIRKKALSKLTPQEKKALNL